MYVVVFVADYPVPSAVIDVILHSVHIPCTNCRLMVIEGNERNYVSQYADTTKIHSANTSFSRGKVRTEALRNSDISREDLNLLGMKDGEYSNVHQPGVWPWLRLIDTMSNAIASGCDVTSSNQLDLDKYDAYRKIMSCQIISSLDLRPEYWSAASNTSGWRALKRNSCFLCASDLGPLA